MRKGAMQSIRPLVFSCVLCAAAPAFAQVEFTARLLHTTALACEEIPIVVTLRNDLATSLEAGGAQGYSLAFEVTDAQGLLIRSLPDAQVRVPASIPPRAAVVFTNDLLRLFPLAPLPAFAVRARLVVGDRSYVTDKMYCDVTPGGEVARLQAHTPAGELRTYTLRVLNRNNRDRLFLRCDNETETACYGAVDLGRFVRIGRPALEADARGDVHVLHLSGPNQFVHSVFSPASMRVTRRTVEGDVNAVRLVSDGQGGYRVAGEGWAASPREPMVEPLPLKRGL
jgi:hypothetical protein